MQQLIFQIKSARWRQSVHMLILTAAHVISSAANKIKM